MALFDQLKDRVKGATHTAVKASSEFIEVTKIKMAIKSEEDKAKAAMLEIGKAIYEQYKSGQAIDEELSIKCDEIGEAEVKAEELKQKILEIKNLRKCAGCGAEIEADCVFCPKCGVRGE